MMSSSASSAAPRVPAWKRLGLKLKPLGAASEPADGGTPAVGQRSSTQQQSPSNKRKLEAPPAKESSLGIKRPRRANEEDDRNAQAKRKPKSVSFGETPTKNDVAPAIANKTNEAPKEKKKSKGPAKKQKSPAAIDVKPALEYLSLWKSSRESWKFNKNHQSTLIKYAFDVDQIPAANISTFYEYIRELKGFIRTRLHETAMEIRTKDAAEGASAFPTGTKDLEAKQISYEALLTELLQTQQSGQKRKGFNEVDYTASSQDANVIMRRLVKRMRAELVLDELSDGEQTDDSRTTKSSDTIATSDNNTATATGSDKRLRLNDGTSKRRRKLRVNVDDDSSSSESESESGSDTSSDGSSSDESESEDEADANSAEGHESSSSDSSSSSSSADESESDDDSDEEAE